MAASVEEMEALNNKGAGAGGAGGDVTSTEALVPGSQGVQDQLQIQQHQSTRKTSAAGKYLILIGCAGTAMAGYDTAVVSGTIDFQAESLHFGYAIDFWIVSFL